MFALLLSLAFAADRADDFVLHVDTDSTTGAVKRTLSISMEVPLDTAKWADERAAAATSLAAWLSWMQTNASANYTFVNGLSSTRQEGLRQALLKGA